MDCAQHDLNSDECNSNLLVLLKFLSDFLGNTKLVIHDLAVLFGRVQLDKDVYFSSSPPSACNYGQPFVQNPFIDHLFDGLVNGRCSP